ncbi:MAG: hypothetical protein EA412_12430 [Chitinophagaceae bacterium]|nr:MAG: hypothetical protein EA412_12430 [Chitinophagaceae bacterium]
MAIKRILYIEQDEFDSMIFEKFIKKFFPEIDYYLTDSIADGAVAFAENKFDLVLCNYLSEDGSVFDLFKIIKNKVPVVIVAGVEDKNYLSLTLTQMQYDYLIKPYDIDAFRNMILKNSGNSNQKGKLYPIN